MRYCCMFEIMTIQMHKLDIRYSEPTDLKSPKQLCSAQCCLSSAETKWRSNHELTPLSLSRYSRWDQCLSDISTTGRAGVHTCQVSSLSEQLLSCQEQIPHYSWRLHFRARGCHSLECVTCHRYLQRLTAIIQSSPEDSLLCIGIYVTIS